MNGQEFINYWAAYHAFTKRCNITIEFAHGVTHTFTDMTENTRRDMDSWLIGADEWRHELWFTIRNANGVFYLNRDYVCVVRFEDVSG